MKLLKWLLILCAAGMVVGGGYVCVKGYSLLDQVLSSESLEDKIDELRQKDGYTSLAVSYTHLDVYKRQPAHRCHFHSPDLMLMLYKKGLRQYPQKKRCSNLLRCL